MLRKRKSTTYLLTIHCLGQQVKERLNIMENNYIKSVAETILSQLKGTTMLNVLASWDIRNFAFTEVREMPSLTFLVNGFKFKGRIFICLNEGADAYEIYSLKEQEKIQLVKNDVMFDEMGDVLDRYIETGENTTEEYNNKVVGWIRGA
mgnify:CR=1 FL=1